MRLKGILLAVLVTAISLGIALAQEPPLPSASPSPAASPTAPITPPPLLPDPGPPPPAPAAPAAPDISQLDALFKQTPLSKEAEDYRLRIEWRQLQNRASADEEVIAAKKAATAARTDLEKRKLLRAYYERFYAKMLAMANAPDVKAYVEARKRDQIGGLAQPRVRPEPPPPAPKPSATPKPSP